MLVKYRMLSTITNANFIADIVGILDGTITSTAGLSAGADTTNSQFTGTYPSTKFAKVNAGTYTFSKTHNTEATTHYFRLAFSGTTMTTFTVAQGYTAGSDTLLNSVAQTVNVKASTYNASDQFPNGINIVMNNNCIFFNSPSSGIGFGLFDLGMNGITSAFANNMKMAYVKTNDSTFNIPYGYQLSGSVSAYGSLSGSLSNLALPTFKSNISNQGVVIENPVFLSHTNQGFAAFGIYGLFKISNNLLVNDTVYNISGTRRCVSNDYVVVAEG
jgi:hypothetical protein